MASYILIHGAWHAGWCWEKVASLLSSQGHQVIAPDLPGHGSNQKPHSAVKFQDYIDCIMACVESCDEQPILVGHSFAGMFLSQVAAMYPGRFKNLFILLRMCLFTRSRFLEYLKDFPKRYYQRKLVSIKKRAVFF